LPAPAAREGARIFEYSPVTHVEADRHEVRTSRPYYYARWTSDRRLLTGGGDRPYVEGRHRVRAFRERVGAVRRHFERLWPSLARIRCEYAWEGVFATTRDGLPYIGTHAGYPRHLFALGYGGNGMTFGFLAAELLLGQYAGRAASDLRLFAFDLARAGTTAARPTRG
jgi:glycine/D-amino acid oxidase-like deaminating enzyme